MGRPVKEKSLTPQNVIDAAIACLDKDGESALGVNRVARELGIKPPAIYKHLDGNTGLRRAVALAIWRSYLVDCQEQITEIIEPRDLFRTAALCTRNFARYAPGVKLRLSHPARYAVMMQYQMKPTDAEEAEIIRESLRLFQNALQLYELSDDALIDAMRMVNAAIYGFIIREKSELMTLNRSADDSYGVMIDALIVAIEYIHRANISHL